MFNYFEPKIFDVEYVGDDIGWMKKKQTKKWLLPYAAIDQTCQQHLLKKVIE
jgi:hypothetical protein